MNCERLLICSAVAALLAPGASALPHYGDENQAYDRIPGTLVTPHIPWARPLAGGPVKALVVIPYNMTRESEELRERISLDSTVIMTAGRARRDAAYSEGGTATPLIGDEGRVVVDRIFGERLLDRSRRYDVILLCKVSRCVFRDGEWAEIVRRVAKDGTGLVWITPDGNKDVTFFEQAAREANAAFEQLALDPLAALPVAGLPLVRCGSVAEMKDSYRGLPRQRAKRCPCRVTSARLGKGRVIVLDYDDETRLAKTVVGFTVDNGDTNNPDGSGDRNCWDYTLWDMGFAACAKAILAATGRDGGSGAVREDRFVMPRYTYGHYYGEMRGKGRGELPNGSYFDCVRRLNAKGEVVDFAAVPFSVTNDIAIVSLTTRNDRYAAGEVIEGDVALSRSPRPGESVVVQAVDTWGRLVWSGEVPMRSAKGAFRIPVEKPLSRLWDIFASVRSGSRKLAESRVWVGIPDWTFDDYMTMLIFCPQPSAESWKGDYHADLMRRYGLNAVYTGVLHGNPRYFENNERHHLASVAYSAHYGECGNAKDSHAGFKHADYKTDTQAVIEFLREYPKRGMKPLDPKQFTYSQWGLNVDEFNKMIGVYRYIGRFGTPHYCLTMENYLRGEFAGSENSGFAPRCTAAFQQWCRREYGDDLQALNREWNTKFASWDEVSGVMLVDAAKDDQLCRWVDFRYFMRREVWGGLFLAVEDYIHAIDPHYGYVGMGGHAQHDFSLYRGPHMTSGKLYVSQKEDWEWQDAMECEMRQSFADDTGWWLGSQSSIRWTCDVDDPVSRRRIAWNMMFMGLQGFDWENGLAGESLGGMTYTYADYSDVLPFTKEIAAEAQRLERGLGKLVKAAKPYRAPVAIDWSPRNHYISRLLPHQPRGFSGTWLYNTSIVGGAPNDALGMMNSLRMRPRIVAPEDVIAGGGWKALWLPYNKGMDEAEAKAIERFVEQGGLVIADNEPGTFTRHGRPRTDSERLLKCLFPGFSKPSLVRHGKGHALYLAGKLNAYPDRMLTGDFAGADIVAAALRKFAGLVPPVEIREGGRPVRDVRMTEYDIGATRLVGVLRRHAGTEPDDSRTYEFDFRGEYDVWDLYEEKYLGRAAKMTLAVSKLPKMLALVPKKLPDDDAWHLEVFGPDGRELECYRRNYVVSTGRPPEIELPRALNAAKGEYRKVFTSAITGRKIVEKFVWR